LLNKYEWAAYVGPALSIFLVFVLYPFLSAVYRSFFTNGVFGVQNYVATINYFAFPTIVENSVIWAVLVTGCSFLSALLILYIFLFYTTKASEWLLVIYLLPFILSSTAAGAMWLVILGPVGLVNNYLSTMGVTPYNWLGTSSGLYSLVGVATWQLFGFATLIVYNGTKNIDLSILEAAQIDGASPPRIFLRVILPVVRRSLLFTIVILVLFSMGPTFAIVQLMTGGGPGYATELLTTFVYRCVYLINNLEQGAAISVIVGGFSIALTVIFVREFFKKA
jgi:ABC-type sugar transport system permease subunit